MYKWSLKNKLSIMKLYINCKDKHKHQHQIDKNNIHLMYDLQSHSILLFTLQLVLW